MYLFLDLSSRSTGWAVSDETGKLVDYGCIASSSQNLIKRIIIIRDEILKLIDKYKITKIVAEEVRTDYKNPHTYKVLTWLQGVIIISAWEKINNLEYEFIQPSSWRSKIGIHTGRGIKREALKQADIEYVQNKYGITANDDICDAIGIMDSYFVSKKSAW